MKAHLPIDALLLAALLAGCSGSSHTSTVGSPQAGATTTHHGVPAPSAPSNHELAQTYLRIVRPANAAFARFNAKAQRWDIGTAGPAAAEDAAPAIAAAEEAQSKLLRRHWPSRVAADIRALVRADGALIDDLHALAALTDATSLTWANQYARDAGKVSAASNSVRAALGLPPANA